MDASERERERTEESANIEHHCVCDGMRGRGEEKNGRNARGVAKSIDEERDDATDNAY